ncbi:uncharacterized protein PHACADRAFT_261722 [Phanerochaete carnosa HHB-10118-sp]|uniref:Uncharacterized protein n=1 Tax=Phanerochaete carnosa (strain HHB-10118-sp) TaxID=650164 RepID=K5UP36_PHACS|nr:uncharacterized protein PHACADRAFT_261722 [Phanerochaete carnosa HHB-10118-sp]EKM51526.1 hypothetical protein PHACADRAFT_261722 [Phanerochaete carnosa HHB-10118-sp]
MVFHGLRAAVIGEFIRLYHLDVVKLSSHQPIEDPPNPPPTVASTIHLHLMSCISGYAMFLHLHTSTVALPSLHASTGCVALECALEISSTSTATGACSYTATRLTASSLLLRGYRKKGS